MSNLAVYAQNITELVDFREAMQIYGVEVNRAGFAVCPFHNEKTPSMKIYSDHFYCFGCGKGGDIISFVSDNFKLGFTETLKKINTDFSLNLPIGERMTLRQSKYYQNQLEEIKLKRFLKQTRKRQRMCEYHDLLDAAEGFERDIKQYAPKSPFDTPHPLFINALKWLDHVNYMLNTFDWEEE